ncbi:hypothetical protein [Microseira sp. BLCC-F43]|jgi:hypothetical protein|uniref:hypothetical protein n=1 Tax=Microseira sp. BLCC-F43 TaxID=3153602 RepID=UPI0035BB17D9
MGTRINQQGWQFQGILSTGGESRNAYTASFIGRLSPPEVGFYESKLRFFSSQRQSIPTPQERAEQEKQEKELAQHQAELARQQAQLAQQQAQEE